MPNGNYECIKIFESGIVKRMIYSSKIEGIVDKLFNIENIPFDIGVINQNISGQTFIQFNSNYGPIIYYYVNSNDDSVAFNIIYPNGQRIISNFIFYETEKDGHNFGRQESIICDSCKNDFEITISDEFGVFICKRCRSIYTYEYINNKFKIIQIYKNMYIPSEIKKILKFFNYNKDEIDKSTLKSKFKELINLYHPDKVARAAQEIQELAANRTKEILEKYEFLKNWLETNGF
jgi:hypothetical protein